MNNKIILWIVVAVVVVGGIWWGISRGQDEKGPIKIGISAVLSGEAAGWGQNGLAGGELALKEVNEKGGINDRKVEFVVEDDRMDPTQSVSIFSKFVNVDKVAGVLGYSSSAASVPAAAVAQNAKVPTIFALASTPFLAPAGDYIFRIMPSDTFQGVYVADLIFNKLNKRRIALVYVKNDWGQGIADVFKKTISGFGGEIVYESSVISETTDFKTELAKIREKNADVLYFPVYPDNAISAFKQIKELGMTLPVICGDAAIVDNVVTSDYTEGMIYTAAKSDVSESFKEMLHALPGFENLAVNLAAPYGYDAARILFSTIEKVGTDPEKIKTELEKTHFEGVSNPVIEFDENGEIKTASFEARIITNKQSVLYNY